MSKQSGLLTCLFFTIIFSCGSDTNIVLTIDGNKIASDQFFASIQRSDYEKLNSSSRKKLIINYAKEWIAASEAKKLGFTLSIEESNKLLTMKNKIIFDKAFNNHIIPLVLNDTSIINTIKKAIVIERFVSEIIIYHELSSGSYVERTPKEAEKIANTVFNRIHSNDITFKEAVSIYTNIPSMKLRNGELGVLPYGKLPKHYSDKIWYSPEGSIIGPIKTEYGYHIVLLGASNNVNKRKSIEKIKNEIIKGGYGVLKEQMDLFSLNLRSKYSASLDTLSIIALWKAIEMEPGYKQKPFNSLVDIDYLGSLGLLGKMPLDLSWFIKHSYQHAEINGSSNIVSHALLLNLSSILDRVLVNMWAKDNNLINYESLNSKIKAMQQNLLMKTYVRLEKKAKPSLSQKIILNQASLKYDIKISENFIGL